MALPLSLSLAQLRPTLHRVPCHHEADGLGRKIRKRALAFAFPWPAAQSNESGDIASMIALDDGRRLLTTDLSDSDAAAAARLWHVQSGWKGRPYDTERTFAKAELVCRLDVR